MQCDNKKADPACMATERDGFNVTKVMIYCSYVHYYFLMLQLQNSKLKKYDQYISRNILATMRMFIITLQCKI